jgi:hypothetical protein
VQQHAFFIEISLLRAGRTLPKEKKLENLNAFLDAAEEILRVEGCLSGSELPLNQRHPPILPRDAFYSRLLVRFMHFTSLNGGPSLTASFRRCWHTS